MIERRQIDHTELVQLGKALLLLFKREELLVDLPDMTHRTEEVIPTEELSRTVSGQALTPPGMTCDILRQGFGQLRRSNNWPRTAGMKRILKGERRPQADCPSARSA
jgi:hypothetical protein